MQCLRLDRGGEFNSNEFNALCNERGIKRQVYALGTPQHNDIVERRNKSITNCARSFMIENNIAIKYWKEEINIAIHNLNRV